MKRTTIVALLLTAVTLGTRAQSDYATTKDESKNQAVLTLKDGTQKYYNTESVSSIDFSGADVTVHQAAGSYTFSGQVQNIRFAKANKSGDLQGNVQLTEAKGWLESAYVKFGLLEGAKSYHVYIKGGQYADYTRLDDQLVRNYGTYGRADAVGLTAGTYAMKVVPVKSDGTEATDNAGEATALSVQSYSRQGFAFMNGYEPGAYRSDGTLKAGAKVIYVTAATAKTVKAELSSGTFTGLQAILTAYEKGNVTTPLAIRFVGLVTKDQLDATGSKEEGLQVKGKKADSELNITFEGIGLRFPVSQRQERRVPQSGHHALHGRRSVARHRQLEHLDTPSGCLLWA